MLVLILNQEILLSLKRGDDVREAGPYVHLTRRGSIARVVVVDERIKSTSRSW